MWSDLTDRTDRHKPIGRKLVSGLTISPWSRLTTRGLKQVQLFLTLDKLLQTYAAKKEKPSTALSIRRVYGIDIINPLGLRCYDTKLVQILKWRLQESPTFHGHTEFYLRKEVS